MLFGEALSIFFFFLRRFGVTSPESPLRTILWLAEREPLILRQLLPERLSSNCSICYDGRLIAKTLFNEIIPDVSQVVLDPISWET